jgi:hypothetical protein
MISRAFRVWKFAKGELPGRQDFRFGVTGRMCIQPAIGAERKSPAREDTADFQARASAGKSAPQKNKAVGGV